MELILREDVPGLGIIGDVVKVKPGYARNYLLPRGLAEPADRRNLKQLEHHKRVIAAKKARERGTHEELARQISVVALAIEARAGKGGKLFGSVTNIDIQRLLAEKGFEIDRRRIELRDPIKEIGEFQVSIRVGQDVTTKVVLAVTPLGGALEELPTDAEEPPAQERRGRKRRESAEETEEADEASSESEA
jgi:large subunit ribosomal protein L9